MVLLVWHVCRFTRASLPIFVVRISGQVLFALQPHLVADLLMLMLADCSSKACHLPPDIWHWILVYEDLFHMQCTCIRTRQEETAPQFTTDNQTTQPLVGPPYLCEGA